MKTAPTIAVLLALIALPGMSSPFLLGQIATQALILGTVAQSLAFLFRHSGQLSLAQLSIAGIAAYMVAFLGPNGADIGPGWPILPAALAAFAIATLFSLVVAALAVRTDGIYCLMVTLSLAVAVFLLARQNYTVFGGFGGIGGVPRPQFGADGFEGPVAFYYLSLSVAALAAGLGWAVSGSPLGLAMRAVGEAPARVAAWGHNPLTLRLVAFVLAGMIAAAGGLLLVWSERGISPGRIDVTRIIDILIIAVIGGIRTPFGAYVGAVLFLLVKTFAIDLFQTDRFNTVIGLTFIAILLVSRDGISAAIKKPLSRARARIGRKPIQTTNHKEGGD
jgi:branched-chain amino acid transport system permease protein